MNWWYVVTSVNPDTVYGPVKEMPAKTEWAWYCVVETCAKDYHYYRGGLEVDWPLTFSLRESEDGPEVARFEVDREAIPEFTARKISV